MADNLRDEYNDQGKELRSQGTVAFPIACYSGDWQEDSVPLHWHEALEAGFITAGQVTMYVGKEKITLNEGDGFFINSGIPHAFLRSETGPSRQCSLVFNPVLVGGRYDSVFWQRYVQPVLSALSMPWRGFCREEPWQRSALEATKAAWQCCSEAAPGHELDVRHHLTRLMDLLATHLPAENPTQARHIARDNERIRTMLSFIQSHFAEELTIDQIAQSALISVSEALRCFHNTIGLTPIQYAKYYRVQRAAALLQNTDRKISRIGEECGFQEMSYFAKVFRAQMGVTPSQYRRNLRSSEAEDHTP